MGAGITEFRRTYYYDEKFSNRGIPFQSKTIEKYLGGDYHVVSSKGHIRDLAATGKGGLGIDVEHDFEPTYKISSDKRAVVKELKDLAKKK